MLVSRTATYKSMKSDESPGKRSDLSPDRTFDAKAAGNQESTGVNLFISGQGAEK